MVWLRCITKMPEETRLHLSRKIRRPPTGVPLLGERSRGGRGWGWRFRVGCRRRSVRGGMFSAASSVIWPKQGEGMQGEARWVFVKWMCHTGRPLGRPCKHCSDTALTTEAEREGGEGWKHCEDEGVTTGEYMGWKQEYRNGHGKE